MPGTACLQKQVIGFRVPEEAGYPDEQILKEHVDFGAIFLEKKNVIGQRLYLMNRQPTFNATDNGAWFVMGKIVAGCAADQRENFVYLVFGGGSLSLISSDNATKGCLDIMD